MQIIDTFSGIGGFSLAGKWMGWRTIQFCEIDTFCQKVLKYYWPGVPIHDDIKTLTAEQIKNNGLYNEKEKTILTGGVPCQPWSMAGRRKGESDDRNLWPQTIKLIGEFQPDYAVLENVYGFINWNGGVFFEQVCSDLEAEGYSVQPVILPAASVGAPHRRDRVWFVARRVTSDPDSNERCKGRMHEDKSQISECNTGTCDAQSDRCGAWDDFPTVSPILQRNDGLSDRLSGITFPKWRNEGIKAMGNSIIPEVALQIFKAIQGSI